MRFKSLNLFKESSADSSQTEARKPKAVRRFFNRMKTFVSDYNPIQNTFKIMEMKAQFPLMDKQLFLMQKELKIKQMEVNLNWLRLDVDLKADQQFCQLKILESERRTLLMLQNHLEDPTPALLRTFADGMITIYSKSKENERRKS
ncbi:MAG: hypothetical protein NTX79_06815 [Candidatus Micrarchaeota archaeon]|nr:hypothetical protein [Candidatus Micrarchaeota archaeon]